MLLCFMVRAIVAKDGDKTFYGTRSAFYGIDLLNEEDVRRFADDLERTVIEINSSDKPRADMLLRLQRVGAGIDKNIDVGKDISHMKEHLRDALVLPQNISLSSMPYGTPIINFVARFGRNDTARRRGIDIYPFGIPNDDIWFNPTPFYELGEKWGHLETGEDFNISISGYREINNR